MFKLSKKVEYGLIAVKHMALPGEECTSSAKVIAEKYKIPYELLSKILQKLKKEGILNSVQGTRGGYILTKKPEELTLAEIFNAIEGNTYILDCGKHGDSETCSIYETCILSSPLKKIQRQINSYFNSTTLSEIV
ncbi:MAG: Rrf2 family transcriptional regulator [Ignavibacteria bacterium]|nr:Rrf2 family transcriptional regulator [Ignavibacteria bacterium]